MHTRWGRQGVAKEHQAGEYQANQDRRLAQLLPHRLHRVPLLVLAPSPWRHWDYQRSVR
jgi:hypothetical protein